MSNTTAAVTIEYATDLYGAEPDTREFSSIDKADAYVQSVAAGLREAGFKVRTEYHPGRMAWLDQDGDVFYKVAR